MNQQSQGCVDGERGGCNNLSYHAKNSLCKINFNQVCLQNPTNSITIMTIKLISIYDPKEYTSEPVNNKACYVWIIISQNALGLNSNLCVNKFNACVVA